MKLHQLRSKGIINDFFYLNVYTCTATCFFFREITNKICSCWTKQTQWGNFEYIMSNYSKQMTKLDGARANKLYICQWCNSQHSNHQSTNQRVQDLLITNIESRRKQVAIALHSSKCSVSRSCKSGSIGWVNELCTYLYLKLDEILTQEFLVLVNKHVNTLLVGTNAELDFYGFVSVWTLWWNLNGLILTKVYNYVLIPVMVLNVHLRI